MFISGDVHFGGSLQNPTASGQFDVRNGTFKYLSHVFNITKGNAHFVGGSSLQTLQLEAETNVSNYTIMLGVKGQWIIWTYHCPLILHCLESKSFPC